MSEAESMPNQPAIFESHEIRRVYDEDAEVDLLVERHGKLVAAYEFKSSPSVVSADLTGLRSFREENPKVPLHVVCRTPHPYEIGDVRVIPWTTFLDKFQAVATGGSRIHSRSD